MFTKVKKKNCPWFYNDKQKALKFTNHRRYARVFILLFFLKHEEQYNLMGYIELNDMP